MSDSTTPDIPAGWYPDPAGGPRPRWWDGTAWTEHYADLPTQAPAAPVAPEPVIPAAAPVPPVAHVAPVTPVAPSVPEAPATSGFTAYPSSYPATTSPVADYPAAAPYSADADSLSAPADAPTNTPWIWIMIFLPLLGLLPLVLFDWASYFESAMAAPGGSLEAELALYTSPVMIGSILGGFAVTAVSILFAFLDWRSLKKVGIPQPFHFLWVLFILVIGTSAVYTIGRAVVVKRRTGSGLAPMWATIGVLALILIFTIVFVVWMMASIFTAIPMTAF